MRETDISAVITANLPSRDFDVTEAFYARLGFERVYRGDSWMILTWRGMQVEFFPHPGLDPGESWFSACLRLREIDPLYAEWAALDWPETPDGFGRLTEPFETGGDVPRMFVMHDPDGSLWRVLETAEL